MASTQYLCITLQQLAISSFERSAMHCFVQAEFAAVKDGDASLSHFRSEISDLNKFAVLNYIAVIKACKKRNRHLQVLTLSIHY